MWFELINFSSRYKSDRKSGVIHISILKRFDKTLTEIIYKQKFVSKSEFTFCGTLYIKTRATKLFAESACYLNIPSCLWTDFLFIEIFFRHSYMVYFFNPGRPVLLIAFEKPWRLLKPLTYNFSQSFLQQNRHFTYILARVIVFVSQNFTAWLTIHNRVPTLWEKKIHKSAISRKLNVLKTALLIVFHTTKETISKLDSRKIKMST